jgi:hypothetical protein
MEDVSRPPEGRPRLPWEPAEESAHPGGASRQEAARIAAARRRVDRFLRSTREDAERLARLVPAWPLDGRARPDYLQRADRWDAALEAARAAPASADIRAFADQLDREVMRRVRQLDPSADRAWLERLGGELLPARARDEREIERAWDEVHFEENAIAAGVLAAAWAELARHRISSTRYGFLLHPWRTVFAPAELAEAKAPAGPAPTIEPERLAAWRALCEHIERWRAEHRRRSVHAYELPEEHRPLLASRAHPCALTPAELRAAIRERTALGLVEWGSSPGKGWRLRSRWRERLAEHEHQVEATVGACPEVDT